MPSVKGDVNENMLRTPAPRSLLRVLVHIVTDALETEHQTTSIDDHYVP